MGKGVVLLAQWQTLFVSFSCCQERHNRIPDFNKLVCQCKPGTSVYIGWSNFFKAILEYATVTAK